MHANPATSETFQVAVRTLCEFTAKEGDLDLRFTPAPTAQEGIAGHAVVAARRGAGYRTEVPLAGDYRGLLVRGRADGYDPVQNRLEEVKTFRGDLARLPENHRRLHWAQAKIYGALLCRAEGLAEVHLALVYFDIDSGRETCFAECFPAAALHAFFAEQCERFLAWAAQERTHREARDRALAALAFPFPAFRPGQRRLAEAVYRTAGAGGCLLVEAPTGIGKTIATLFPLLKAMPGERLDKIFFLTAKTPGRRLALTAAAQIGSGAPELPLRVLELVARDKACAHPEKECHGASCPLAHGFYDRLPAARQAAVAGTALDRERLREVAAAHAVCPYYLGQELVRWADLIVGDYNHYFDLGAMLHTLTVVNQWRVGVLVDEAHNLLERGRRMYSAELDQAAFREARRAAPPLLGKALERVRRRWREAVQEQPEEYRVHAAPPPRLLAALQTATAAIADHLADHPEPLDPRLQAFHFDALHFCRLAELYDEHFLCDSRRLADGRHPSSVLCLRNLVPAPFLAPRYGAAQVTILFSATLRPAHFYRDLLGLPVATPRLEVPSPFAAGQLTVRIVDAVSTRFRDRAASLAPIVSLIAAQFARKPGNYLAFFSSYDYLEQVAGLFAARHPQIPLWRQERRMEEAARDAFLAQFVPTGRGIGFAVLGGAFGEGIDLPGERLIGAFIATLGLPQLNPVNEEMRNRIGALFGAGYDYTYLFPGVQKVVQAAGRVIRSSDDRGIVYLIDDRFARPEVRRLLPGWWEVGR